MIHDSRKRNSKIISNNLLHSLSIKDSNNFWKIWNSNFKPKSAACSYNFSNLDQKSGTATMFADHFRRTATPNNSLLQEEFKTRFLNKKNEHMPEVGIQIGICNIEDAIYKISENAASGHDNLDIEHIKFAHPSLWSILARLFLYFLSWKLFLMIFLWNNYPDS